MKDRLEEIIIEFKEFLEQITLTKEEAKDILEILKEYKTIIEYDEKMRWNLKSEKLTAIENAVSSIECVTAD